MLESLGMKNSKEKEFKSESKEQDRMREPGFVYTEYDRGARGKQPRGDDAKLEESAETESQRAHEPRSN